MESTNYIGTKKIMLVDIKNAFFETMKPLVPIYRDNKKLGKEELSKKIIAAFHEVFPSAKVIVMEPEIEYSEDDSPEVIAEKEKWLEDTETIKQFHVYIDTNKFDINAKFPLWITFEKHHDYCQIESGSIFLPKYDKRYTVFENKKINHQWENIEISGFNRYEVDIIFKILDIFFENSEQVHVG